MTFVLESLLFEAV